MVLSSEEKEPRDRENYVSDDSINDFWRDEVPENRRDEIVKEIRENASNVYSFVEEEEK